MLLSATDISARWGFLFARPAFEQYDTPDSTRVAVVNEHLAEKLWPHQDAIGKRFHLNGASGPLVEVVGVAKQSKYLWISENPADFFYLPFSQSQQSAMTLVTESPTEDASVLAPVLRGVVHNIDPNMPAFDSTTMQDIFTKRAIQTPGIIVKAVAGMGIMALVLAAIGLYGLIAYSVSRRTREIGIRMAVGADQRGVLQMILRQGLVLAITGAGVGLLVGVFVARLVGSMFIGSNTNMNPALFPVITIPLLLIALLAAYALLGMRHALTPCGHCGKSSVAARPTPVRASSGLAVRPERSENRPPQCGRPPVD